MRKPGATWGGGQDPGCWDFAVAPMLVILAALLHMIG